MIIHKINMILLLLFDFGKKIFYEFVINIQENYRSGRETLFEIV